VQDRRGADADGQDAGRGQNDDQDHSKDG
jgi:hypothetical protein